METQHSPLPWSVGRSGVTISDGSPEHFLVANCHENTLAKVEANAAFIVRACNNHDALVEALENLCNAIHKGRKLNVRNSDDYALMLADAAARKIIHEAKGE